jgi:hypothetical protein
VARTKKAPFDPSLSELLKGDELAEGLRNRDTRKRMLRDQHERRAAARGRRR